MMITRGIVRVWLLSVVLLAAGLPRSASADVPHVGYKKGFFIQSSDQNYKLKLGARVQARYAATTPGPRQNVLLVFKFIACNVAQRATSRNPYQRALHELRLDFMLVRAGKLFYRQLSTLQLPY